MALVFVLDSPEAVIKLHIVGKKISRKFISAPIFVKAQTC